jgi:hypothetical protein
MPHPALQEYVLNISTGNVILLERIKDVVTPYAPTPFQSLMFYCNHPISMGRIGEGAFDKQPLSVIIGPQFSRVNIKIESQLCAIRVDFFPGGMYRMLGIPMHELSDGGFDTLHFFGAEMKCINEQLQNTVDVEEGKNIVEKFLLRQVSRLKQIQPFDSALRILLNNSGNMSIEKTASL